ncbi:MAG: type II toxin-antitoxin system HicB family antitoxin [Chloroflexota bacterium]
MMNNQLEAQAKKLADQPYHMVFQEDHTTDDEPIYVVNYLEMPGCRAQGFTIDEALADLKELTYEYILSYLEHGVAVPKPYSTTIATTGNALVLNSGEPHQNPATQHLSESSVIVLA